MSTWNLLKDFYLAYLSKPASARCLYRTVRQGQVRSIVEIGVRDGARTRRLLEMASRMGKSPVRYTGIDLFEARGTGALSLKTTHQLLKPLPAKIQLVPGDPYSALARTANTLMETDLLIVADGHDAESLERSWLYVPRMLHAESQVFIERGTDPDQSRYERLSIADVQRLGAGNRNRSKRAA